MLTVGSFFAPRSHPWNGAFNYIELLKLQKASCERFGARQIVLTDFPRSPILDEFETFESPLPESLMQASLHSQRNFLGSWMCLEDESIGDVMLIDADCIVSKNPREVFENADWDIGVTVFPFHDSILNNGAIYLSELAIKEGMGLQFWDNAISRVTGDHWGDDQASLKDAFEATLTLETHMRCGTRVRQFSCVGYNEAPDAPFIFVDSFVVHFRGPRKVWAHSWAKRFMDLEIGE